MSSNTEKTYIVAIKRTPFGKFGGSLTKLSPVDLAEIASKAALESVNLSPTKINQVIVGNVVPSSTDTMYGARHLALRLGMNVETPGHVVNRLCGSGIEILLQARNLIELGQADSVLCCGTENMSMVPHLTYGARFGTKYGSLKSVDMLLDALTDKFACVAMGETAENLAEKYNITREESDQFSLKSHQKAVAAYKENHIQKEIVEVESGRIKCSADEHIRQDASLEGFAKLRTSFKKDGVVTPGSASGIVDGASCLIVANESFCQENNLTPLAEILDGQVVGVDPKIMGIGPVPAIQGLLKKLDLKLSDIDLIEINEAFAAQAIACVKELGIDEDKFNIWGGATAIGHPLGATGTRITGTLINQLHATKKSVGIASACIGGGQGIAIAVRKYEK